MANDSDENKVVPFPAHKTWKRRLSLDDSYDGGNGGSHPKDPQQNRRVTILISLVSTVFVASLINNRLSSRTGADRSRDIASASDRADVRDIAEDIILAKKIARQSLREPASRGRQPTSEEKLQFEQLNPYYRLNMNEHHALVGINHIGQASPTKQLKDPMAFISDNRDMLKINFDRVGEMPKKVAGSEKNYEIYDLMRDGVETPVAYIHFTYDQNGNFLSMNVEPGG